MHALFVSVEKTLIYHF